MPLFYMNAGLFANLINIKFNIFGESVPGGKMDVC
jgi:hypothetical protein